jgi:hypothetical protein
MLLLDRLPLQIRRRRWEWRGRLYRLRIRWRRWRSLLTPQVAREIIAADKPKFVVMMIGNNDRQTSELPISSPSDPG